QRKFGKSAQSGPRRHAARGRYIPAAIRREVWERDGGQCTFVSNDGKRCEARARLEYDHANPVARGGETTVAGLRLRCRPHNQYAAECTYGAGFMSEKREEARRLAAEAKAQKQAEAAARARAEAEAAAEAASERDVV